MSQTPQQQGTTLQILAPYLPYGIEVEWESGNKKKRATMSCLGHSWRYSPPRIVPTVDLVRDNQPVGILLVTWCLPVLRPFPQLCEPLPDGTVPAVEVAKILIGGSDEEYTYETCKLPFTKGITVLAHIDDELVYQLDLQPDWDWWLSDLLAQANHEEITVRHPAEAIDYLRSQHFALPVNGRPLLEGIDFIPKSVSGPTTEEGGKP